MKLGIDLDGVCYDFVAALQQYAKDTGHGDLPYAESWDFFKNQWGWDMDTYFKVFGDGVVDHAIFWEGEPEQGCVKALTQLKEEGHRLVVITHRSHPDPEVAFMMQLATVNWLYAHKIPYDSLFFEGRKVGLGIDLLLDDAPHTIQACMDTGEGIVAMDRPWNQGLDVMRAYSWSDFVEIVHAEEEYRRIIAQSQTVRRDVPA